MDAGFNDLLNGFLDQRLAESEISELRDRIHEDPALAEAFVASCIDEAKIADWSKGEHYRTSPKAREDLLDEFRRFDGRTASHRRPRRRLFAVAAAVSASLLIAAFGLWWSNRSVEIGRIKATANCVGLERGFDWQTIRVGRTLRLDSGVLEVETDRQVKLVLEGPCQCRFDSQQQVQLLRGRVYAEVPEAARGFTIATSSGTIVDLGTVFGVEVDDAAHTEVHVFDGLVTATLGTDSASAKELRSGQAVVLNSKKNVIDEIDLSEKFVRGAEPFVEHFDVRERLIGENVWMGDRSASQQIRVLPNSIEYAGLARGEGGKLEIGGTPNASSWSIGRRWHDRFFSMLVYPDDDFPKRMGLDPATLISFGPLGGLHQSNVRLVVSKRDPRQRQSADFGLMVDGVSRFDETRRFKGREPCLVVIRFDEDRVDLWINPTENTFGNDKPPEPDVTVQRSTSHQEDMLWINDPSNPPKITWYFIDEIRGGSTWAEVTPKS